MSGRWMGSEMIEEKSNEIPAGRKLIEKLPVDNAMILTDALHTQFENARKTVMDYGADYFMTVKGNQKTLKQTLEQFVEKGQENSFFPS
jgi:predicted transposase YbfD/YdcC